MNILGWLEKWGKKRSKERAGIVDKLRWRTSAMLVEGKPATTLLSYSSIYFIFTTYFLACYGWSGKLLLSEKLVSCLLVSGDRSVMLPGWFSAAKGDLKKWHFLQEQPKNWMPKNHTLAKIIGPITRFLCFGKFFWSQQTWVINISNQTIFWLRERLLFLVEIWQKCDCHLQWHDLVSLARKAFLCRQLNNSAIDYYECATHLDLYLISYKRLARSSCCSFQWAAFSQLKRSRT